MNALDIVNKIERQKIEEKLPKHIVLGSIVNVEYLVSLEDRKPQAKKSKAPTIKKREKTIFEGILMEINKKSSSIRVLKVHQDPGHRVEKIFPLIGDVKVNLVRLPHKAPRRAKLFYLRDRAGKKARV